MTHIVRGTGVQVAGNPAKVHARLPEFNGRHLWVFAGVWQVANPAASAQSFDMENLLTIEGPGCFWCEQRWVPTIGAKCPGEPTEASQ
jgi:hypothetical protein